jgi:hypothetical protein
MIKHKKLVQWENKLKKVFDKIDDYLENKYGKMYPLHPRRAKRGRTSNKQYDGLFDVGASYSLGLGSKYGKGYVIDVRLATLYNVPEDIYKHIQEEVIALLKRELPVVFPHQKLKVARDGEVYKIYGDFSLGSV